MLRLRHAVLFASLLLSTTFAGCLTTDDLGPPAAAAHDANALHTLVPVVSGLDRPLQFVPDPRTNGTFLVAEMSGTVRTIAPGAESAPVLLNISARLEPKHREQGLLGLALHPDFPNDPRLFVTYTAKNDDVVLSAFPVASEERIPLDTEQVLLRVPQYKSYHNGGHIAFGPDGLLYAAFGDGSPQGDPQRNAQNLSNLLGTMIRIDVDVEEGYGIPSDNPFVGRDGRDEIWLYGLRNPWRFSFDALTSDLWVGDVGFLSVEEIDRIPATLGGGHNLGWPRWEGSQAFADGHLIDVPVLFPIHEYPRGEPCSSVTGGLVSHDPALPTLLGAYLFADFCTGEIHALRATPTAWDSGRILATGLPIAGFAEGPDQGVYVLSYAGDIYRLAPSV